MNIAYNVNFMLFWCSSWWTSKPGQRECLPIEFAEKLPEEVSRKEGRKLRKKLMDIGCWKHAGEMDSSEEYLAQKLSDEVNEIFKEMFEKSSD